MLYFQSDYLEGCDPSILALMNQTNLDQTPGYGEDPWCDLARERIREAIGLPEAAVYFLVGGTQTNSTVIRGILRNYEGVISAETGHVCGHEGGAIEATGHKVLTLPGTDGKLSAERIEACWRAYAEDEACSHLVRPGMVYLSHPTELGSLYKKAELEAISAVCRRLGLPLFIDGARLGYGLASRESDLTLADIARLADVFYIGGTKVGALFGEAVVVPNPALLPHFFTTMKQSGAVLAKGRLLGIQFAALFDGNRYLSISAHA
ncbi:L-threonine aldolase, partial [gut metagenome]